jgi:hypothetical protein
MKVFVLLIAVMLLDAVLVQAQVQDNFDHLVKQVEEGKTYGIRRAKAGSATAVKEVKGYYIRLVPPVYKQVWDTIELSPALNGNLDTSNYFIQTEVLVLKEAAVEWKLADVSPECTNLVPEAAICLLKTTPRYEIVNKKFFPFKNITDTSNTDYVIPRKYVVVMREELVEAPRLERLYLQDNPQIGPNDRVIRVGEGIWEPWTEVVCPMGLFNTPSVQEVQEALKKEGYTVKMTNSYDEQTKRALHEFQRDNMLEVGELDEMTINRLGIKRRRLIEIKN